MAQRVKNLPAMWEIWVQSLDQEDPLERKWQPTLVGSVHGISSLGNLWMEEPGGLQSMGSQKSGT